MPDRKILPDGVPLQILPDDVPDVPDNQILPDSVKLSAQVLCVDEADSGEYQHDRRKLGRDAD